MGRHGMATDRVQPNQWYATDTTTDGSYAPSAALGLALIDRPVIGEQETLFQPSAEPTAPPGPEMGQVFNPVATGRRAARGSTVRLPGLLPPEAATGAHRYQPQHHQQLEQAVEDVFTGSGYRLTDTGELVRPYVASASREPEFKQIDPVWEGSAVPPPTPVLQTAKAETDPVTEVTLRPVSRPLPSRRQLREQRQSGGSERAKAVRNLAKGGVLAASMFGVVASNAPQALHDKLFGDELSTVSQAPGAANLSLAAPGVGQPANVINGGGSASARSSVVDDTLRNSLVKAKTGKTVSEAGQSAAGAVLAAAAAQSAVDAATAQAAFVKVESEVRGNPRAIAQSLIAKKGWSASQWQCLDKLWHKESGWRHTAKNPSSSAYGIPQALPGIKMASAGSDWRTNPTTQIKWGIGYIEDRYGTPCNAWGHSVKTNWY